MPVEAVICDIGGVFEINPSTGGQSLQQIDWAIAAEFGLDGAGLHALMQDVWEEYVGTLNRELVAYVRGLRPRYRTGILSNSFVGAREREQAAYGFAELCEVIVYSHDEGCLKPDPRIYEIACQRLGVAPEAAVLVHDLQENVDGAIAVGMHAVLVTSDDQTIADLRASLGGQPR